MDVTEARPVTRETFFDIADPWLRAQAPYIRLDFHHEPATSLPAPQPWPGPPGKVISEHQSAQVYQADIDLARPAFVLFRMTYHPAWQALVDSRPVKPVMLTPGFLAAPVPPGRHTVIYQYAPGNTKLWILLAGLLVGITPGFARRRRRRPS